jgi:hypothetical protein
MIRIRSEHAIGFLKGRFHSLKHLRIRIVDEKSHRFATYWIAACVTLHAFAIRCEAEENEGQEELLFHAQNQFINEGLSSQSESDALPIHVQCISRGRLQRARARREQLKRRLFRAKNYSLVE